MSEVTINLEEFKYALSEFGKGEIFEDFAKAFLSIVFEDEFIPVGGTKDKGIDSSMRLYNRFSHSTFIYQISTELSYEDKLQDSIDKLKKNHVTVDKMIYVTGRKINSKDTLEDNFLATNKVSLSIYDVEWFASRVSADIRLAKTYKIFIESNIHEFRKPNKEYVAGNLVKDPRLYVFMRQQFDSGEATSEIKSKLIDSLILYVLEGTSNDDKIYKNIDEIRRDIANLVKFNPESIYGDIDSRLHTLSSKPKKINYHSKENAYCMPFDTRLLLEEREIEERHILDSFQKQTTEILKKYLKDDDVVATKLVTLINATVHKIYHNQGLQFSSFILEGKSSEIFEAALPDIISEVIDESHVQIKNKEKVKQALLMTLRHISYNGTKEQREYLRRMSHTYNMMFLLRWDPQLATGFQAMASKLKIYVCTSIIIPALSEFYLKPSDRRYWNLLSRANLAGVQLTINATILNELVKHFGMIRSIYKNQFKNVEEYYLEDELRTHYIDDILIRAYFYSKSRDKVKTFNEFIENFAHPSLNNAQRDLLMFLKDEFQIQYEDTSEIESKIDSNELKMLSEKLTELKKSTEKAKNDAKVMLMIYKKRELNNEMSGNSIFGYQTWWLSQDTLSYVAVKEVFNGKYGVNCYLRSDFLYNYIAMAPKKKEVDSMFKEVFPSLLGINMSYHLPKEVCSHINKAINEHSSKSSTMVKRALRNYSEKLMTSPNKNSKQLNSFFDEELKKQLKS